MPEFDPNTARGGSGGDEDRAVDLGRGLHQLSLRYWSEGRPEDALRVDLEAAKILGPSAPDSPLMADVAATLEALVGELRAGGIEQDLLGRADELIARLSRGREHPGPGEA